VAAFFHRGFVNVIFAADGVEAVSEAPTRDGFSLSSVVE
jgi:hypothetical protein